MTLESGRRLGPYEVFAPIGAGGMGEVYRARDAKLLRDVALKILPAAFAADPEHCRGTSAARGSPAKRRSWPRSGEEAFDPQALRLRPNPPYCARMS